MKKSDGKNEAPLSVVKMAQDALDFSDVENPSDALSHLRRLTRRLSSLGFQIITSASLAIFGAVSHPFFRQLFFPDYFESLSKSSSRTTFQVINTTLSGSVTLFCLSSMLGCILFDVRKKHGDVLFSELSDEFQFFVFGDRRIYKSASASAEMGETLAPLEIRVALRAYAKASELPLFPGRFGPAIMFSVSLIVAIAYAFLAPWRY